MSVRYSRSRYNNTPVSFSQPLEITYWAKKYNLTPKELEKAFVESSFSMTKAIELCTKKRES